MMLWKARIDNARNEAKKLLRRFGVESACDVNVEGFADRLGLRLVDAPLDGATAQLVVSPARASIILSDRLVDPRERRWAISHELGHYVLRHPTPPTETLLGPRPGVGVDLREAEADCFALVLLTPERLVRSVKDRRPMTLLPPMHLAAACGVSLEAAAIRVAETTERACAVALSNQSGILWVAAAARFLDTFGERLAHGRAVDPRSVAWRYLGGKTVVRRPELIPCPAWLDVPPKEPPIMEHSLPGSEPGTVLTMLWAPYRDPAQRAARRDPVVAFAP